MEGSTASAYMLTMAAKMFRAGFNVVRVNYRNCGGTEHLSPTLYHGGLTADGERVVDPVRHLVVLTDCGGREPATADA